MPIACLALAALAAFAVARLRWGFAVAAAVVVLAADLYVTGVYDAAAADRGNPAYDALVAAPPGRVLELPVLHPGVQLGSIYLWYDQAARRERPGGYSTIAPDAAAVLSLRLRELNCGDWRRGDDALLRRLGVRYVAFHRGLIGDAGWFAWRGLQRHGFGPLARGGAITMLERGRAAGASPVPEPAKRIVFCQGWNGRSPAYSRAAFWARGPVSVGLTTRRPVRTTISVDQRRVYSLRVTKPFSVRVAAGPGWHLIGIDVRSAANGLQVRPAAAG
jgi:hypothetical protein